MQQSKSCTLNNVGYARNWEQQVPTQDQTQNSSKNQAGLFPCCSCTGRAGLACQVLLPAPLMRKLQVSAGHGWQHREPRWKSWSMHTHSAMWHLLMKGFALPYPYREPKSGILKNGQFNITCPNLAQVWGTWHCSAVPATGTSHPEDQMWICSTSVIPWEYPWRLFLGIRSQVTHFRVTRCFYGTAAWT